MSNVEQFQKAVTDAGAVATQIMRRSNAAERLVILTPGGLITREVPLRGDFGQDIQAATTSAKEIRRERQTPYITTGQKSDLPHELRQICRTTWVATQSLGTPSLTPRLLCRKVERRDLRAQKTPK